MLTAEEFERLQKVRIYTAPSLCDGHLETEIWYTKKDRFFYVLKIKFKDFPDAFICSPCTFTPYQGMDQIDGFFTADAETYVLSKTLGYQTNRLDVFGGEDEMNLRAYLKARGLDLGEPVAEGIVPPKEKANP